LGTEETSPGRRLKSSITDASRKIEGIIDDAERAAAEILAEARVEAAREAQRTLSSSAAELGSAVLPLVERVENLRVEAAALMLEIESAASMLKELTRTEEEQRAAPVPGAPAPVLDDPPEVAIESSPASASEPALEPVAPGPVATGAPGPAPVAYAGTGESPTVPEEALLRATQMAVAGSSRGEIESTLRDEFDLEDATPVVNEILGDA